jgi:hypothetical protein
LIEALARVRLLEAVLHDAEDEGVGVGRLDRRPESLQEPVAQVVHDVEAPACGALLEPAPGNPVRTDVELADRRLLDDLKSATVPTRQARLLAQVEQEIKSHTTIEEEIFYPAFRAARLAPMEAMRVE